MVVTEEDRIEAWMAWAMRDVYKEPIPEWKLWWGAFVAIWCMLGKSYLVDAMWSAATGEPMTHGTVFRASPEFREASREHLIGLGIKLP